MDKNVKIDEGLAEILKKIIQTNNLKKTIYDQEKYYFENPNQKLSSEAIDIYIKLLEDFRILEKRIPQDLYIEITNILGVLKFFKNKVSDALIYFAKNIQIDKNTIDSQLNILECLQFEYNHDYLSLLMNYSHNVTNDLKFQYYSIVHKILIQCNNNIEKYDKLLKLENNNKDFLSLCENIFKRKELDKNIFYGLKLLKFYANFLETNNKIKESIELCQIIILYYPQWRSQVVNSPRCLFFRRFNLVNVL